MTGITARTVVRKSGGLKGAFADSVGVSKPTAADTLRSVSSARIAEVLSEGPIKGFHTGDMRSVYLDKTPVLNDDLTANFTITEHYLVLGVPDQDVIPGFAQAEAEIGVGVEVRFGSPVIRRVSDNLSSVRLKIRVPALYEQEQNGDIVSRVTGYVISYRVGGGGWIQALIETLDGKTMSPYERQYRVQLPPNSVAVDFEVTRVDPDDTDPAIVTKFFWSSYTEITDLPMKYDDTAVVAMVIDAQYFPQIPTRGYLLDGLLWSIPSNYDPIARTYSPVDWDGTFVQAWTNNPAWVLYGLLTNDRFGTGRKIDASAVDKWSFYDAAKYNDELVPDGYGTGGTEPRFTSNFVLNTRQDAFVALTAVASTMWAQLYYSSGTIFLVQDRPQLSAVRGFSPANVENGIFDYAGTDVRSMFNAVAVTWNDPSQSYEPDVELVLDHALVAAQGYRDTNLVAFGTTSRGQAIRWGRRVIYTAQHETEIVTFRTGLENADVRPGERIDLTDPSRAGARLGGRTLDDQRANRLTLDRMPPELQAGWTIYLTIGSAADAAPPAIYGTTVLQVNTVDQSCVVNGKPASVPPGSMWLASSSAVAPTPWRVNSIKDLGQGVFEIAATEYDGGKYAYADLGVLIPPPSYSLIPTGPLKGPTDIAVAEYIYLDGSGVPQFGVVVSWSASSDPRVAHYNVEMSGPAGDYRRHLHQAGVSLDVPAMRQGAWTIYVTAEDNIGRRAPPLSYSFTTQGLTARPLAPLALYSSTQGDLLYLTWVPTSEIDVLYFWLAWHPATDASATWERATTVAPRIPRTQTQHTLPLRVGTYFLKTVDSLGQTSVTAATTVIPTLSGTINVVANLVEQTAWAGVRHLWTVAGVELTLPPPSAPEVVPPGLWPGTRATMLNQPATRYSVYEFANALDMGAVGDVSLTATLDAYGNIGNVTMSTWLPLASAVPLANGISNYWDGGIEVALSQDASTYAAFQPLQAGTVRCRAVKARLVGYLYDLATTMRVLRAELLVDVPDRTLRGSAVAFDGSGRATVTYATPFAQTPSVQFTGYSPGVTGATIVIISSTKYTFVAEQRRDAGTAVAGGSFNWLASGFGVSA